MNYPRDIFAKALVEALSASFKSLSESDIAQSISNCDYQFGDYSTNIAFKLSKIEGIKPSEVAEKVLKELKGNKVIEKSEFLEPGFINITLASQVWSEYLLAISQQFGQSKLGKGKSIQIEFISGNPTGPLVVTNAWQGYYGDILANVYASQGYKVAREYYLNDGGNQIVALGQAVQQSLGVKFDGELSQNLYRGEYIDNIAVLITTEYGSVSLVTSAKPILIGQKAAKLVLTKYILPDLDRLGVKFDSMYSESQPDIPKTLKRLDEAGLSKAKEGALWLDGGRVGLNQDEVLVRSYDNEYTYFLKDIAYQLERLEERGFDQTITIVGPDHHGQAIRLINTLRALGHTSFKELSTQTIRLIKGGKEFKMSKRKGNYVLLDDFLDSVPTEAARFYFAMRDTNTHMDFDINLVTEHSSKNPVYYALYAYARACSIQVKASEEGLPVATSLDGYKLTKPELKLALELSKIPTILTDITASQKVHHLLYQVTEVARAFHEYYEQERILSSPDSSQKLMVIAQFKLAYQSVFHILGITLQSKM